MCWQRHQPKIPLSVTQQSNIPNWERRQSKERCHYQIQDHNPAQSVAISGTLHYWWRYIIVKWGWATRLPLTGDPGHQFHCSWQPVLRFYVWHTLTLPLGVALFLLWICLIGRIKAFKDVHVLMPRCWECHLPQQTSALSWWDYVKDLEMGIWSGISQLDSI